MLICCTSAWGHERRFGHSPAISALAPTADKSTNAGFRRYGADSVEKVENTAKKKFSQKLAGGGFLLTIRSSCEEEGRRKLLFKSTWSTVSDGFKRISGP